MLSPNKTSTRVEPLPLPVAKPKDQILYYLVLVYIALWIFEGGLRRWILPSLSNPLLLIRDPLVVLIYSVAAAMRRFPFNIFISSAIGLALLEAAIVPFGHGNPIVGAYGIRSDFLHVPMIFIIGRTLTPARLMTVCQAAVILSIPYTLLLVAQFYSPQSAWVNRGLGGSLEGAGFSGAEGKFRPPGTFSFITGPAALYPMFAACWFLYVYKSKDKFASLLGSVSALAILVAIPVSISRSLFISVLLVVVAGVAAGPLRFGIRLQAHTAIVLLGAICLAPLALTIPAVQDGLFAFSSRWTASTTSQGGVKEAILQRFYDGTLGVVLDPNIPFFGSGTGYSTNFGQQQLRSFVGFGNSEGEFGRLLYDNGVVVGGFLLMYRVALALFLAGRSFRGWFRNDQIAFVFLMASFLLVLSGQWSQTTAQGAATIAAGLTLAACRPQPTEKPIKRRNQKKLLAPRTEHPALATSH